MSSSSSRSKIHRDNKQSSSKKAETNPEKNNPEKRSRSQSMERYKPSTNSKRNDPSPQKSRSVSRAKPKEVPDAVSKQKSKPEDKKVLSSSPFRGSKMTVKNEKSKMHINSTPQAVKPYERTSRQQTKGSLDNNIGQSNAKKNKNIVPTTSVPKNKKVAQDGKKKPDKMVSEISKKKDIEPGRPRTSTIRKGPPEVGRSVVTEKVQNLEQNNTKDRFSIQGSEMHDKASEDEEGSYEEDFEDYDSDFEESDSESASDLSGSDSVPDEEDKASGSDTSERMKMANYQSGNSEETNVNLNAKSNPVELHRSVEKTFLHLSDSSYLKGKTREPVQEKQLIKSSYSFINFASAVEQEREENASNHILKNSSDFIPTEDPLDLLTSKNDAFIRFSEKKNCKHVYVQTDNQNEEETQTEEIETSYKWTQNPPSDSYGYGGDSSKDNSSELLVKSLFSSQKMKLSSFIQNCGKVFLTLLYEEFPCSSYLKNTNKRDGLFLSIGYYTLATPEFLKDAPVLGIYCHSKSSMTVLTIHDGAVNVPHMQDERGVVCVWNVLNNKAPENILVCHSQPICASFGPIGNDIVLAGTFDGSILLWDLSDSSQSLSDDFPLKAPSYNTALVSNPQNHHSCIIAIQTVVSSLTDETSSASFAKTNASRNFHVLALEDVGVMNIWVVVEVMNPDFSGLDSDLGLSPCGKLRLVKSSTLLLCHSSALLDIQKTNIRTFDFCVVPFDSSRLLVTTDAGLVLHVDRYGRAADPRFYSSDLDFASEVRCISSSPHNKDLFLVGCSDGSAMLYNVNLVRPVLVLLLAAKGEPVSLIQWSPFNPSSFVVLSLSSSLHLWNLMEDTLHPVHSYDPQVIARITWFTIVTDENVCGQTSNQQNLYMCIALENGDIEIHATPHVFVEKDYSKQMQFMLNL